MKTMEKILLNPMKKTSKFIGQKIKPAIAILLTIIVLCGMMPITALAYESYGFYVCGEYVTSNNASNITGDGISGTVYYTPSTKTLTLDNATIYAYQIVNMTCSIYTGTQSIKIKLIGENTLIGKKLTDDAQTDYNYSIGGFSDATITGNGSLDCYGRIYEDELTIDGNCTVSARINAGQSWYGPIDCDIFNAENFTILGSTSPSGTPLTAYDAENSSKYKYVKIQPAYNVTVSFDANGGTGTMSDQAITCGNKYTLPENGFTAPSGKEFKAWNIDGNEKAVGDEITPIENTTITAVWKDVAHTCNIQPVEKVNPTCTDKGKEAYYKCEVCGKFFEDENGSTEIADLEAWGNLDKLDHAASNWKTDKTHHWKECTATDCGVIIENSKEAHTDTNKDKKCDVCSYSIGASAPSSDLISPPTGDNSNGWLWIAFAFVNSLMLIALFFLKKHEKDTTEKV